MSKIVDLLSRMASNLDGSRANRSGAEPSPWALEQRIRDIEELLLWQIMGGTLSPEDAFAFGQKMMGERSLNASAAQSRGRPNAPDSE